MFRKSALILAMLMAVLTLISCSSSSTGPGDDGGDQSDSDIPTTSVSGTVEFPTDCTVDADDLRAVSFIAQADVSTDGAFSVDIVDSDTYQWVLIVSKGTGNPVFIALYDPTARSVVASSSTTALALCAGMPHLIFTTHSERENYLDRVADSTTFDQVLANLNAAYASDAEGALDPVTNSLLYQFVAQAAEIAFESLGSGARPSVAPPHIEDAAGDDIVFVSERQIWYTAGIYDASAQLSDVVTVDRDDSPGYAWGWPPAITTGEQETTYALGDGTFAIALHKGDDFTKVDEWSDPVGRATALNVAQGTIYLVELLIGYEAAVDAQVLSGVLTVPSLYASELALDMRQGRTEAFISHFSGLIGNEADDIADWLHGGSAPSGASETFLEESVYILEYICYYLDLLSMTNTEGPFFWDWVMADIDLAYDVTQEGGVLTTIDGLTAPNGEFTIDPPAGIVGTVFEFDASGTTDDNDPIGSLLFRWDWNSDGNWDTSWSSSTTATHSYSAGGAYSVSVQVKDTDELKSAVTHNLNVGGGGGTATHIKLFRDVYPWSLNSTVDVIESLGFTSGTGPNTYEIVTSSEMATEELIPGEDLVIICNDQVQSFYDNYAASQVRFNNFVYMGGSLLWEACDQGWSYGSMETAGIVLPGNVGTVYEYWHYNYIPNPELPLVAGLPTTMDHNYASHESFSNLPDGTTVYCVDQSDNPTLVEYSLGAGWVVMSGQPLEHQHVYIYGDNDMEELLPRIISYFTGVTRSSPVRSAVEISPMSTNGQ
jgi:hypothetical protein